MSAEDWRTASDDDGVVDDVHGFLRRFVAFPSQSTADAATLWVVHTHVVDSFDSTPRLAALSPEPGSGKTRLLEVLELLVPNPMVTVNVSAAALFRKVADPDQRPTVLLDEADTYFGPRSAKEHEDLRGLVNAGHRNGATATRCVVRGKTVDVEDFPAFAAVALAGLDDLPDTIMSRSVVIRMRRRAPDEPVEPFRRRVHGHQGEQLRERLASWADRNRTDLADAWPELPEQITDRPADVWEPLIAVADAAGGDWPQRARVTAVTLVTESQGSAETLGVRLLRDIRDVFAASDGDRLPTVQLLAELNGLDESPWGDLRGSPMDARGLSRRLSRYGIKPHTVRIDETTVKGYERGDFADTWSRYLPVTANEAKESSGNPTTESPDTSLPLFPQASVTSVTSDTPCRHGKPGGDQPDPFVDGRLACPQCRAEVAS